MSELRPGAETRRFGRTATLLSAGVGAAGLLTYFFFSLASHNLGKTAYGEIVVLWSAVFVTISVAHRPVEQMLSRTLAERRARGEEIGSALRVGAGIQLAVAAVLGVTALALRDQLQDRLLWGIGDPLLGARLRRGHLRRQLLRARRTRGDAALHALAALLVCESAARAAFALAVAIGIAEGQATIALGVAAAPAFSLAAVPLALLVLGRRRPPAEAVDSAPPPVTVAAGGSFAAAVLIVMLSEQAFLNAGPLLVRALEDAAAAGFIFNVLMVARAPVLVFQGVATSLLPHLTRLRARGAGGEEAFHDSIRTTLIAVAGFSALVFALVAAIGPEAMQVAFGDEFTYDRLGLMLVAAAMGFYLAATTLNQAALAHGAAARAARCWAVSAAAFPGVVPGPGHRGRGAAG